MKIVTVAIAVVVLAGYIGFKAMYPSATIHYRLTIAVDTPEGVKTGSDVVEVTYAKAMRFLGSSAEITIGVKGEAVAVDLGRRGVLFALLKAGTKPRSAPEWILTKAFGFPGGGIGSPPNANVARLRTLAGRRQLTSDELPMLVRFRDIDDPKSVERVDPDDLAASFGPGVRLAGASIEITDDPVTTRIKKRLPWLAGMMTNIDGTSFTSSNNLANRLNSYDFARGTEL